MTRAPLYSEVADGPGPGHAVWLTAADGVRIRAGYWNAKAPGGTVLLLPGRSEYVEKYGRAATDLAARGFTTLTLDWRGQGLADRAFADPMLGHVGSFDEYQSDLDALIDFAVAQGLPRPFYLMAHSMGGCIGLRGLMRGIDVKAAAFSAPMWGLPMASWLRPFASALAAASRRLHIETRYAPGTGPGTYVLETEFGANTLTTDADMWDYMRDQALSHPELSLGGPSMGWARAALEECRALELMPSPHYSAVCALGAAEKIVDADPIHRRMAKWPTGKLEVYPAAEHEVMMETPAIRARFFDSACALFGNHR